MRWLVVAAIFATTTVGAWSGSLRVAAATSPTHATVRGDFNGDGYADLAIGIPGGNGGVGAVIIMYGSVAGLTTTGSQYWTLGSRGVAGPHPAAGDLVGESLAIGDFNHDGYADLAVGVPGADGVLVLYGSESGLQAHGSQFLHGRASSGFAVAAGDFNGDGYDDLAVGTPFANANHQVAAGAVEIHHGSATGLSSGALGTTVFNEASAGMPGPAPYTNDNFGLALTTGHFKSTKFAALAIGVPNSQNYGAVIVLYGSSAGLTAASSQYLESYAVNGGGGSALAAADFNHDGLDDLAVGDPDAKTSSESAGAVEIHYGSSTGLRKAAQYSAQTIAEASLGMPGPGTANLDKFGFSLAAGDFNGDGVADLAVGTAGKSASFVLYGSPRGITTNRSQYLAGVGPQVTSQFSSEAVAVAGGDFNGTHFDSLVLGEPFADTAQPASGIIEVHPGSAAGVLDVAQGTAPQFAEGNAGMAGPPPGANDNFGFGLAVAERK